MTTYKNYSHISECWDELAGCKTVQEMREKFEEFPRWSGDWELEVNVSEEIVTVTNTYFDKLFDSYEEEKEDYDIYNFDDADIELKKAQGEEDED